MNDFLGFVCGTLHIHGELAKKVILRECVLVPARELKLGILADLAAQI